MNRLRPVAALGCTLLLSMAAPAARAAGDLPGMLPGLVIAGPFTAAVTVTSPSFPQPTRFEIYYTPQNIRIDGPATYIVHVAEHELYLAQGNGSWLALDLAQAGGTGLPQGAGFSKQLVGHATKFGHACTVYRITGPGVTSLDYLDGGYPVYAEVHARGATTEVRFLNLHPGPIDPARFRVDAARVQDMSRMLRQLQQQERH